MALNAIEGVEAKVDLKKHQAEVRLDREIDEKLFIEALEGAGLEFVSISDR